MGRSFVSIGPSGLLLAVVGQELPLTFRVGAIWDVVPGDDDVPVGHAEHAGELEQLRVA